MRTVLRGVLFSALLAQAASFEVATVRITHTDAVGDRESYHDGLLRMSNVTLRQCIRYAYEISEPQIAGGPKWIDDVRFDIVAKSEQPYPTDDFELLRMLKPLLAERFQLAAHHETRSLPGYALTLAKGGIQAKVSDPATRFGRQFHSQHDDRDRLHDGDAGDPAFGCPEATGGRYDGGSAQF